MSYQWELSDEAKEALNQQLIWYETDDRRGGAELADRWLEGFEKSCEQLVLNPLQHPFAPENGKWQPKVVIRQMLFRPWKAKAGWRVLYTVDQRAKLVSVLQIRHEHRRWLHESKDEDA